MEDTGIIFKRVSVLVHGVRRQLHIDTDPARLRSINKLEYAKYAEYAESDLIFVGPCTFPAPSAKWCIYITNMQNMNPALFCILILGFAYYFPY
jgi:hypothetical protein